MCNCYWNEHIRDHGAEVRVCCYDEHHPKWDPKCSNCENYLSELDADMLLREVAAIWKGKKNEVTD